MRAPMFRSVFAMTIAAFVALMAGAAPARAEYCEEIAWGEPRFPDGPCDRLHARTITWSGGSTELVLLAEREVAPAAARVATLRRLIDETATGVSSALGRISGVRFQARVHVVIVNDFHREGARAETVRRPDDPDDCALMLYDSATGGDGALARTIAHELFHCVQYRTWPLQMAASGSRWWSEGSAEWFEDLALPARVLDSDLIEALRAFRARSGAFSLIDNLYGNAVFFAWLGPERVAGYVGQLATGAESQLDGARRAMDEGAYTRFAQAYVDETIRMPSGLLLAGPDIGPSVPPLHTTTGVAGADPRYAPSTLLPALTVMRGVFTFASGDYAPHGDFGGRAAVFAERQGEWSALPGTLRAECGRRPFKVAAMSHRDQRLIVDPGARATTSPPCTCPLGQWTVRPEDLEAAFRPTPDSRLVSFGDVFMQFNRSGDGVFAAQRLRFQSVRGASGPVAFSVTIERSYRAAFTWSVSGDEIVLTDNGPMEIAERTTHFSSGPYGGGVREMPTRRSEVDSSTSGRGRKFRCDGNALTVTPPFVRIGPGREWVDRDRELRYPYYGVFVRS